MTGSDATLKVTLIKSDDSEEVYINFRLTNEEYYYLGSILCSNNIPIGNEKNIKAVKVELLQKIALKKGQVMSLPIIFIPATRAINFVYGGDSSHRPKINTARGNIINVTYFDTDLKSFIYNIGNKWYLMNGLSADIACQGVFENKPKAQSGISIGFSYFCTDRKTTEGNRNGIMIYYAGEDTWVDSLGRVVE